MDNELKPLWSRYFRFNWKFGFFLLLVVCVPRFFLVLKANQTGNYANIGLIMTISAICPFIFLSKYGRRTIGLSRPKIYAWLYWTFLSGLIFSVVLYAVGDLVYGGSFENWYVYIKKSYNIPAGIQPDDKLAMFIIMSATGMIFSPIGEELFFRGIVHSSFAKSFGDLRASLIDSIAFALTHISHFGLVFISGEWKFFTFPTIMWVCSMFIVSILFYRCRRRTDSILGAIVCHAGFNLGMIYCIFYLVS